MYTLDIKKQVTVYAIVYAFVTIFCFVFQLIYLSYSHDVSSSFMKLAFLIPLVGGVFSLLTFLGEKANSRNRYLSRQFLNGAVIWLTLGSIFKGVLDIYGTTNQLVWVFLIVGFLQVGTALGIQWMPD